MTVPVGFTVSAAALAVYREWERLTNELAVAVSQLGSAIGSKQAVAAAALVPRVETLLQQASNAAGRYAEYKIPVAPEVQQRWVSVLTRMQAVLRDAKALQGTVSLPPLTLSGASDTTGQGWFDVGFQIPGTRVVVPWVAVAGIVAVVGVAFYMSKRRR